MSTQPLRPAPFILIPAYQPGATLPLLVGELRGLRPDVDVLVVDDGSGPVFRAVFAAAAAAGARVEHLQVNGGKGHALKVGMGMLAGLGRPVVSADADGQHSAADILRVADSTGDAPDHLVLGVRAFDTTVPVRSRLGNDATRLLFRLATGQRLRDTQTGLRGFPAPLLPWLVGIEGERYEYELTMLLRAARSGLELRTIPIETIYLDDNASSHFRPVADSMRIYLPLLGFLASSLLAFTVDVVALIAFSSVLDSLLAAVVAARVTSASLNFVVNRRMVFDRHRESRVSRSAWRYALLATGLLALNYLVLSGLQGLGAPLLLAKLGTEVALVVISYSVQSRVVFSAPRRRPADADSLQPS
ncbi:GtrA family protein [Nocardioides sp. Kera G14]|uniref:GtrA family protein n=1 Tax=Nocardioides sp. Kera G14 TaxID=2884264 RepID=UPI001D0F4C9D|nr:GtrA family protein [Nocardioides sp. Kera G14]UDY24046.1 GtrA family protein [Nocardioides sp. Kera G14]